jgi:hypothetical protein
MDNYIKNVQHPQPSGKCKTKLHCDSFSLKLEWLLPGKEKPKTAGEDSGKKKHLYTVGRNVN